MEYGVLLPSLPTKSQNTSTVGGEDKRGKDLSKVGFVFVLFRFGAFDTPFPFQRCVGPSSLPFST